jgi:endonuclease YncB( thermonuclease family)
MGTRRLVYGAIWASICWWLAPNAAFAQRYIPDCAGSPEIAQAHIIRVERNGDLILAEGRVVVLEGIRLPDAGPRHAEALSLLRASKGPVTFAATPPKRDRYGRIRAQGFAEVWLQIALLEKGLAQVALSPDRDECFPELYEAESLARSRRTGIWADRAYQPHSPQTAIDKAGFHLVEGRVANVRRQDGWTRISFEGGHGVSGVIAADDRRAFRDFHLEGLEAHRIRIRGIVQTRRDGSEIALFNPAQIELLD